MPPCLIGLGSNLGDSITILERAIEQLEAHPKIQVVDRSSWLITHPVGGPKGQADFVNAAILLETELAPQLLLAVLQGVEDAMGRVRGRRWGPRLADLDLLLYGETIVDSDSLTIPHPRMVFRRFVLEPAAEIAAEMTHPLVGWTVKQLLDHLNSARHCIAVLGEDRFQVVRRAEEAGVIVDSQGIPRLIILLSQPAETQQSLVRQISANRQAPTFVLDATDPDWALTEIVAAFEAMK